MIETKPGKSFYFIGVTTTKSSIMKIFPLWMNELGFPEIKIYPYDLKIHDNAENYRQSVAQIKYDRGCYGALVTTHKMDLYASAKNMFDYFDYYALLLEEVSCISKNNGRLEGHAKDPISSGAAFDSFIGKEYFKKTGAHVLIFGAGGSSIATILHLINKKDKADRPERVIVINRSQPRLDHLNRLLKKIRTDIVIDTICNSDPEVNDKIVESLPDCSIVINATGMGKDTPGSPVTDNGFFPLRGWAWDFNYRGELDFLHQAEKQKVSREVKVEDGWIYFIHGWTQVIFQVLHLKMNDEIF
ncbi:MAG: shikimate dehydrogenase, partial [Actinobacteria bacterium]|nr:shikimate dehydrogenase [Actinomycetota bacterium]